MLRKRIAKRRQLKSNQDGGSKEENDENDWVLEDEFDTSSVEITTEQIE